MKRFMISLIGVTLPWAAALAQEAKPAAPTIALADRHGHVTPVRQGFNHTGGGNIDVAQPAPDSVLVTMSGVATAGAHPCKDSVASMTFELTQCFEVTGDRKGPMKIVLEARAPGSAWIEFQVIRTNAKGRFSAQYRFRFAGPATYQFRAVSEFEADFPFLGGASNIVQVFER